MITDRNTQKRITRIALILFSIILCALTVIIAIIIYESHIKKPHFTNRRPVNRDTCDISQNLSQQDHNIDNDSDSDTTPQHIPTPEEIEITEKMISDAQLEIDIIMKNMETSQHMLKVSTTEPATTYVPKVDVEKAALNATTSYPNYLNIIVSYIISKNVYENYNQQGVAGVDKLKDEMLVNKNRLEKARVVFKQEVNKQLKLQEIRLKEINETFNKKLEDLERCVIENEKAESGSEEERKLANKKLKHACHFVKYYYPARLWALEQQKKYYGMQMGAIAKKNTIYLINNGNHKKLANDVVEKYANEANLFTNLKVVEFREKYEESERVLNNTTQ